MSMPATKYLYTEVGHNQWMMKPYTFTENITFAQTENEKITIIFDATDNSNTRVQANAMELLESIKERPNDIWLHPRPQIWKGEPW